MLLTASHDGYLSKFGVIHQRVLMVAHDGTRLDGEDTLNPAPGGRIKGNDTDYALRFHLHPSVKASRLSDARGVMLVLPNRDVWTFEALDDKVELEDSVFLAGNDGPRRTAQIVIKQDSRAGLQHPLEFCPLQHLGLGDHRQAQRAARAGIAVVGFAQAKPSLRAKRSNPEPRTRKDWIASSQELLAMTVESAPHSFSPRFHAPQNPCYAAGLFRRTNFMTDHRVTRALLSVSDKSGLIEFARALAGHGIELVSTGGTAKAIAAAGLKVTDVSELTGFPEMMDGRVKTLHPKVHGGLLAIRGNAEHTQSMKDHGIAPIDLLVVNLYPFEATVDKGAGFEECIENIDIGGPAMIRAAAKNHDDVAVVVEPQDYQAVLDELAAHKGATTLILRRRLAAKAYARTAAYDAAISNWFAGVLKNDAPEFRSVRRPADPAAALWREPAPDGGILSHAGSPARRRHGAATAGPRTVVQQHQRHRRGLRMHRRVRRHAYRRLRHRQARQSLRRRRRRRPRQRLSQGAGV